LKKDLLETLTGVKKEERVRVFLCFLATFSLLISYYMIKPYRNSSFINEFNPNLKPLFYLCTATLSLGITKIFNYFFERIDMHGLLRRTFVVMIGLKVFFAIGLSYGGKAAVVGFFFFASVYFLLCVAVTWGSINFLFTPEQSRRTFGFIAMGGTFGGMFGSKFTYSIIDMGYKAYLLPLSGVVLGLSAVFMYFASRHLRVWKPEAKTKEPEFKLIDKEDSKEKSSDFSTLWNHHYIHCLAVMVFALAVANTVFDLQSDLVIDQQISKSAYEQVSSKTSLNFDQFYGLKSALNRESYLQELKLEPQKVQMELKHFEVFQKEHGVVGGKFYSQTYLFQGIVGLGFLFLSRFIFNWFGVRFAALLLPSFFLIAGFAFLGDLSLELLQLIMILAGALNYSLNNATKEVLYTPTRPATKGKYKALIEGPVMRMGDVLASAIKVLLLVVLGQLAYSSVYLFFGALVVLYWMKCMWYATGVYQKMKDEDQMGSI